MYDTLKQQINDTIKANGKRQITGTNLNQVLNAIVSELGEEGASLGGFVTPSQEISESEGNIFYIASEAGTYTNFDDIVVGANEIAFLYKANGEWTKASVPTYVKPSNGIPSTDLDSSVQTSLGKADTALQQEDIAEIESVIPAEADKDNKLADKNYVDTNISTASATFRGTSAADLTEQQFLAWANALTKDNNDYVFWNTVDSDGDEIFKRYKWDGTQWSYEFTLSNTDKAILYKEQNLTDQQRNTALANVSNQTANSTSGKMGYKVLQPYNEQDPSTAFAEQIKDLPNTIFEIRDVFDLGGTQETPVSVTLPAGSVLKFNGGVIKNCTLQCSLTQIQDDVSFDNVVITGSVKNDELKLSWWKLDNSGNDSTYAINNKNLQCLLTSSYNTSKPAIIDRDIRVTTGFTANHDLICEQSIHYYGDQDYDGGVITLKGRRKNYRVKIYNATASGTYETRKDLTIAGVKISSLICSSVKIDFIQGFTSGLLVESLNGNDYSSYSDFYLGEFIDCYNFVKIHCETTNSSRGWFTETKFHGGRFLNSSSSTFNAYARSFVFFTESTGNMPSVGNLVIEDTCIEGSAVGIYVDGLKFQECKFINLRNEDVTTLISENNVPLLNASYNNYLSVYRWDYTLDGLSTKLFNVVTPNSKGTNTYIWRLNAAKVGAGNKFTFKNTISSFASPSGVYYIQPIYVSSSNISEVQGKNDRLLISGSYKGALLLFKHNGRFQAKIKTLYPAVASANVLIFIVQDTYNTTNSGYRVVDNTDVTILNSGLNKQTTPYRISGNLNVTNNIGFITINLSNIPSNTYVAVVVDGEVGDLEFCTKKENILIPSERDIFVDSLQPTKLYGATNYGTLFKDTTTGKICRASCDRDGVVTSIVDSNGFADAKAIGDTASRPNVAVKNLSNNGYPYYDKTLKKQLYFDSKVTTAISSTQLNNVANIAVNKYISNPLVEGKKYYLKIIQLHQNAVVSITLCKSSSSTEDGIPVDIESVALSSTGKYTLETVLFTAPDPTVYTHINITIDSGANIKFLTGHLLNEVWLDENGYTAALSRGADTDRPTLLSDDVGFQYFDTTLGKYICWNGADWVNFDGTALT